MRFLRLRGFFTSRSTMLLDVQPAMSSPGRCVMPLEQRDTEAAAAGPANAAVAVAKL
jgi:hypothetical protein